MIDKEFYFILELLSTTTERGLVAALRENPQCVSTRNAYVDYLLEEGRISSAEYVREGWTPGVYPIPKGFGAYNSVDHSCGGSLMSVPKQSVQQDPRFFKNGGVYG